MKKFLISFFFSWNRILLIAIFLILIDLFIFYINDINQDFNVQKTKLTAIETQNLEKFFEQMLLRDQGIYVLFGSKPMMSTWVSNKTHEEEINDFKKWPEEMKIKALFMERNFKYEWWDNVKDKVNMKNYLIIKRKTIDPKIDDVLFINIKNTIKILSKHYSLFKEIAGVDFNPENIIFEIKNENSSFWDQILKSQILQGIVFGYGKKNAIFFDSWAKKQNSKRDQGDLTVDQHEFTADQENIKMCLAQYNSINYNNLPLPLFRYVPKSHVIDKYKKERHIII